MPVQFRYLGSTFTSDHTLDAEIADRASSGNVSFLMAGKGQTLDL